MAISVIETTVNWDYPGAITAPVIPYPTSIQAKDLLVMGMTNKYPPNVMTTPSGWVLRSLLSGGNGASGVNSGEPYTGIYTKLCTGSETGSLTMTITGNNCGNGKMIQLRNSTGNWGYLYSSGSIPTPTTSISMDAVNQLPMVAGDLICVNIGYNCGNISTISSSTFTVPGLTLGSAGFFSGTDHNTGDNVKHTALYRSVTSGTPSGVLNYTATASVAGATYPCGKGIIFVIREMPTGLFYPSSDITDTGWTNSVGTDSFALVSEPATPDDTNYITSPALGTGSGVTMGLDSTLAAGTYRIRVRAKYTQTSGQIKVYLLNDSNVSQGDSGWQALSASETTYTLPITTTGNATRVKIDVQA